MFDLMVWLGITYTIGFFITLFMSIKECIEGRLPLQYYLFSIPLAALWPLIGYALAKQINKQNKERITYWREEYIRVTLEEVKENEVSEETTQGET